MSDLDFDLFAGPGGWDTGQRLTGDTTESLGFEINAAACATARAAGHTRVQIDVARVPVLLIGPGKIRGLKGSPPCTTFSGAGQGAGRLVMELLCTAMTRIARGRSVLAATRREIAQVLRQFAAHRYPKLSRQERSAWARKQAVTTVLVLQPMRYAVALRPQFIALEQAREVAPLWRHMVMLLRELGYSAWSGVLSAEEFGVPQTRKRAILVARRDGLPVGPPPPTHQPYRAGRTPDTAETLFGAPLPPPVSMAQALGWDPATVVISNYGTGGDAQARGQRGALEPAATVTSKVDRNVVQVEQVERQANGGSRPQAAPSLTITASMDNGNLRWVQSRPATTVCGDARLGAPGHRDREAEQPQFGEGSVRVTVAEAGVLQSFPPDYPWQGTKSQQFQQCGNAVPPLLAAAVLRPLLASAGERAA